MRTITERIAKRIRRGQAWNRSSVADAIIVKWAQEYAAVRQYGYDLTELRGINMTGCNL